MRFLLNQFCLVEWVSLFTQHNWVKSGLHVFVINLELKVLTVFSTYQGCYKISSSQYMQYLLHFSKTQKQWKSKAAFTIAFFATVNPNYSHKKRALEHTTQIKIHQSPITNHQSQTMTFWTCWSKFLFPERSSKMIDGSEKRKRQLVFELWNSRVFEKHCNRQCIVAMGNPWFPALSNNLDSRKPRAQKPVLTSCQGQEHFPFGQGIVR